MAEAQGCESSTDRVAGDVGAIRILALSRGVVALGVMFVVDACGGGGAADGRGGMGSDNTPARVTVVTSGGGPVPSTLGIARSLSLQATVVNSRGAAVPAEVTWSSSNGSVASVSATGVVRGEAAGTAEIRAATGTVSGAVTLVVRVPIAASIQATITAPATVLPNGPVGDSVQVVVNDANDAWVSGGRVVFRVTGGGGRLASPETVTTVNGRAAARWVAGATGSQTLEAHFQVPVGDPEVRGNPVVFAAQAVALTQIVAGEGQRATILSDLPIRPAIRVVDVTGAPRAGVPVTFSVASGHGRVAGSATTTDANGIATAGIWSLGDITGAQTLTAQPSGGLPVTFSAIGTGTAEYLMAKSVVYSTNGACALSLAGEPHCWGNTYGSTPTRIAGTPALDSLAMAGLTGCGLTSTGDVWCWGFNGNGEFGLGTTSGGAQQPATPGAMGLSMQQLSGAIQTGYFCGVARDATGYCWGHNGSGTFGIGTRGGWGTPPTKIGGGFSWKQVSAGETHACGITTTGQTLCWGRNEYGQLGDGTTTERLTPVAVSGSPAFVSVEAGETFTCGRTAENRVWCWGRGDNGFIGNGSRSTYNLTPVLAAGTGWTKLSGGWAESCALDVSGEPFCWGVNMYRGMGVPGDPDIVAIPAPVSNAPRLDRISSGLAARCGIEASTSFVICWGDNRFGGLGRGYSSDVSATPMRLVIRVIP